MARNISSPAKWTAGIVVTLLILIFALSFADEPMRRSMERRINERLTGYTVRVPRARFHLFNLAVALHDVTLVQQGDTGRPVAVIPRLRARLQWRELLSLKLVSDFRIERPMIYVNLRQWRRELADSVALKDHGWQQAALAIFPFKINNLRVIDGDVVYVDEDPAQPLHIAHVDLKAGNIRNIQSKKDEYPSTIHAEGVVFEKGHAVIDGRADFLAIPSPALRFGYTLRDVPLGNLQPVAQRQQFTLTGGTIASNGTVETGPGEKTVHVNTVTIDRLTVDYKQGLQGAVASASGEVSRAAAKPAYTLLIDTVSVVNSEFGVTRSSGKHPYRLFLSDAAFHLQNYSNHFTEGTSDATLRGRFMGSGRTAARLRLRPAGKGPSFDLALAIDSTPLTTLNEMLRANGKLDVTKGTLEFYSELSVANGRLTGYAKPLFKGVQVYSVKQDKHDSVLSQLYELIVSGVVKLFENRKTGELATRATLNGPVGTTNASAWEVISKAFENAFIRAITPGLDLAGRKTASSSPAQGAGGRPRAPKP